MDGGKHAKVRRVTFVALGSELSQGDGEATRSGWLRAI